jgi:hypothetical protein
MFECPKNNACPRSRLLQLLLGYVKQPAEAALCSFGIADGVS